MNFQTPLSDHSAGSGPACAPTAQHFTDKDGPKYNVPGRRLRRALGKEGPVPQWRALCSQHTSLWRLQSPRGALAALAALGTSEASEALGVAAAAGGVGGAEPAWVVEALGAGHASPGLMMVWD